MKPNGYKGPERRTYIRLEADYAVNYIKLSNDLKPIGDIIEDAYAKDISGAGLKFITSEEIKPGALIEVHVKIPTVSKYITAIGRVLRCESDRKKTFAIAMSFAWITKSDRELVDEYVKKLKLNILRSETKM
ncbi:MAG: PilZ domain-containing protein [Candidatus Omnitrophica bacterium]|nr:PilZ domain-containing protein [Candidatus Omnitrophota bacterium]MBU4488614.1 PilZ domain-containing protein [Candidatus Omnitrophota bacterium]MCG2705907.1 PilZ domain-containing protein [Candidatus Omnitrophota bacterium]